MSSGLTLDTMATQELLMDNTTFTKDRSHVDSWFLMSNPGPVALITLFYLGFVLRLGPAIMKNRQPLKLKNMLLFYNITIVIFSVWWMLAAFEIGLGKKVSCQTRSTGNEQDHTNTQILMWYYLMSKFVELLDTVFFVLRKKHNQVSFLHVYHHSNMVIFSWAFLKYVRGDQMLMIAFVNTAVHIVMYTYYFLAALGHQTHKLLWFKPCITWIQMGQFVFLIGYLLQLLLFSCDIPRRFTQFAVVNTLSFLVLFVNFYNRTYSKVKAEQCRQLSSASATPNMLSNKDK